MANKKVKEFLENFDANTMRDLTRKNRILSDLLRKVNSQIIREIILNARDYWHQNIICTTQFLTSDDNYVIDKLKEIGYNVNISNEISKSGEWWTVTIK